METGVSFLFVSFPVPSFKMAWGKLSRWMDFYLITGLE